MAPTSITGAGETPLHLAIGVDDLVSATLLRDHGADINQPSKLGTTPLHTACRQGSRLHDHEAGGASMRWLLGQRGIDVFRKDRNGHTPLHIAAMNTGQPYGVELLQQNLSPSRYWALADTPDNTGAKPVALAAETGQSRDVIDRLSMVQLPPRVNFQPTHYRSGWLIVGHGLEDWEDHPLIALGEAGGVDLKARRAPSWEDFLALPAQAGEFAVCLCHSNWDPVRKTMMMELGKGILVPLTDLARVLVGKGVLELLIAGCLAAKGAEPLRRRFQNDPGMPRPTDPEGAYRDLKITIVGRERPTLTTLNMDAMALFIKDCAARLKNGAQAGDSLHRLCVQPLTTLKWNRATGELVNVQRAELSADQLDGLSNDEARHVKESLLFMHTQDGDLQAVEQLLGKHQVNPNAHGLSGHTALHLTCWKEDLALPRLLLQHGATAQTVNAKNVSALCAASGAGHIEVVRLLLNHKALVHHRDDDGQTALFYASAGGRADVVDLLLRFGSPPGQTRNDGATPLHIASENGHETVVAALLDRKVNQNARSDSGETPFLLACTQGHLAVVEQLLLRGADAHLSARDGTTALHAACKGGHGQVVALLLARGANVHLANNSLDTPLWLASLSGSREVVELLLDHQASIDRRCLQGTTALFIACENKRADVVALLLARGADPHLTRDDGITPLHIACAMGDTRTVQWLLDKGAVNDAQAQALAQAHNHPEIVDLLS